MEAFYVTKPDLTTDCIAEKLCELKPSLAKENVFIIGEGYYENVLDLLLFKCRSAGLFKVSRTCTYTICIYLYRREGRMTSISIRLHFCRNYAQHSQHFHLVTKTRAQKRKIIWMLQHDPHLESIQACNHNRNSFY